MQKVINFLRGSVRLEAEGAFPERFLNLCAQNGVAFWAVEWLETGRVALTVPRHDARRAEALGERASCQVTRRKAGGVPFFLARFRKRYALLAGLVLSLAAVCVLSQFVLTVEVSGNETVTTAEILTELRRLGVRPGVYGPDIDPAATAQKLLLQLDDLSWCAINLKGTVAEVLVRERIEPPEVVDETELGDVVAAVPGIVTQVEVLVGEPAVEEGDTVVEGQVLITGNIHMEGAEYSGIDLGWRQVRAQGRVYARTWRTLEAEIPLTAQVKAYTGEEKYFWSLSLLGWRVNFYGNSGISYERYDKISDVWTARLPGGQEMPLSLTRETVRAYETVAAQVDPAAAEQMLRAQLEEGLMAVLGERGQVVSMDFAAREQDGMLLVRLQAVIFLLAELILLHTALLVLLAAAAGAGVCLLYTSRCV